MLNETTALVGIIGVLIFTGVLACQHTLSDPKWRDYAPGKITCGLLAGIFVVWIIWAIRTLGGKP